MPQTALLALLSTAFALTACSGGGPANSYTITGRYLTNDTPNEPTGEQTLDPSTATITLSIETETEAGEVVTTEIGTKVFHDGKVQFTGRIHEPTTFKIAAKLEGQEEELVSRATIAPGTKQEFAFININRQYRPYRLALVGTSSLVADEEKKYSISGNLNQLAKDSKFAILSVETWKWDINNDAHYIELANVVLDDGGYFLIEGQVDEPMPVEVVIDTSSLSYAYTPAIIEPKVNITITAPGSNSQAAATMPAGWFDLEHDQQATERQASASILLATAGTGRHARLVESWQGSFEYRAKLNEFDAALQEWLDQPEGTRNIRTWENNQSSANDATDGSPPGIESPSWSPPELGIAPAVGCEHVDLLAVRPFGRYREPVASFKLPPHAQIRSELYELRTERLTEIAFNSVDPIDSLLALEMGLGGGGQDELTLGKRVLARLDDLDSQLDEELVARLIAPRRTMLTSLIEAEENAWKFVPGQKAPEFSLPNLKGKSVALSNLVQENDTLLLIFWRPAEVDVDFVKMRFRRLRDLHAQYTGNGFEIVSVVHSTDSTDSDKWHSASEELDISWPNLGDIGNERAESVAYIYGAWPGLAKNYLLDSQGCIIQRDLAYHELHRVLEARYTSPPLEN